MAIELCTSLGLVGTDLSGKLILVEEEHNSSASFMISSLMWNASRSETSVCLLALHNPTSHYESVTKKLGYNLKTALDNKTAIVVDPFNSNVGKTTDFSGIDMSKEENLKRLFFDLKEAVCSLKGKKCLIIDDLSDLLCLGASVSLVSAFVQYCRSLQANNEDLAVIVCTHVSDEVEDQKLLSNFIAHIADYRMTVSGLKTGFSTTVTGSIDVFDNLGRERTDTTLLDLRHRLFHFRLSDRQIKVFAPGTVGIYT